VSRRALAAKWLHAARANTRLGRKGEMARVHCDGAVVLSVGVAPKWLGRAGLGVRSPSGGTSLK
jgi:hypothetical protein